MIEKRTIRCTDDFPQFRRNLFSGDEAFTGIGGGFIGGKAAGLASAREVLRDVAPDGRFRDVPVSIPALTVIGTDVFDAFLSRNDLTESIESDQPNQYIAEAFMRAEFPSEVLGDLRGLVETAHRPLAIRSSSMLEDATYQPFAGVYSTKMIPNNQPDADSRFRRLIEAIRFVYASTFFKEARGYMAAAGAEPADEKMAVIIQEVVGHRFDERFYPTVSGVARSYNYYSTKPAQPEDGVIELALGLGKTIVDGEASWSYSPSHPKVSPPCTMQELLRNSQTRFWAVGMGKPPVYDPVNEAEYLVHCDLSSAEYDGSLEITASTFDPGSDRLVPGIGRAGVRVISFAPILHYGELPLNELLVTLLKACEGELETEVEMEFAVSIDPLKRAEPKFGFLQVRPIVVSRDEIDLDESDVTDGQVLVSSDRAMGHGVESSIADIVYIKPAVFDKAQTRSIARQIGQINLSLRKAGRQYVLVSFGRLGSSDPWLGVPVDWGEISEARVLVESTLENMNVELSQGSHFFHNMTSRGLLYLTARHNHDPGIRWELIEALPAVQETEYVRHVRLDGSCVVKVDGRKGRGVIIV